MFVPLNSATSTRGHNLVQDPSFPQGSISEGLDAKTSWKVSDGNGFAYFQGPYVGIVEDQKLWQIIELPVEPAAQDRPDYWLSCEYDPTYYNECWLRVYDADNDDSPFFTYTMRGNPPKPEHSSVEHFVNWHVMSETRIDIPKGVRRLRVQFETPDRGGYLYLRNVNTHLRLPAFDEASDVQLLVERSEGAPIVQSTRPFRLCHGATHHLKVKAPTGNVWEGQKTSLLWMAESTAPIQYGLTAEPGFNYNDADIEDYYLPLSSEDGASWTLTADATLPEDLPADISLGLGSYWQAEKHPIAAKIGDYHCIIEKIEWDGVVPVVAESSTKLTAIVKNPFVPDRPVVGQEVTWSYKDEERVIRTDANGRATLEYTPEPGDAGETNQMVFTAQCKDALQQTSSDERTLPVFEESPWLKQVVVTLDDEPIADLTALAVRLTRGARHTLTLKPTSPESYFVGKDIALSWSESPDLGIILDPPAGDSRTLEPAGMSWTIEGGAAESGLFTLRVAEVADEGLKVPLSLKGIQLSANLADEAELKVAAAGTDGPNIFRRNKERAISLVPFPQSPLADAELQGWLTFVERGLSQDKVVARPTYSDKTSIESSTTWTLKGVDVSGLFGVQVHVEGLQPLVLDDAMLLSLDLNDEAQLQVSSGVGGSNPPIFHRDRSHQVKVVPKASSPLSAAKLQAWLEFKQTGALTAAQIPADPAYGDKIPLSSTSEWALKGVNTASGVFALEVKAEGFEVPLTLAKGVLLSQTLSDEAEVRIDGQAPGSPVVLHRKRDYKISITPKKDSPLGETTLATWLTFTQESLSQDDLKAFPTYGDKSAMTAKGLDWLVTGENVSGQFTLDIEMEGFLSSLKLPKSLLLSSQAKDEFDLIVSESSATGVGYFWRGTGLGVSLKPKDTSPLKAGTTLQSQLKFKDAASLPEEKMKANPSYGEPRAIPAGGHGWTLTGATDASGWFGLEVWIDTFETPVALETGILMSTNLADEAELTLDSSDLNDPPIFRRNQQRKITLSPRSGSPLRRAVDLRIQMTFNSGGSLKATDIPAAPGYGEWTTVDKELVWTLDAKNTSGLFGVTVYMEGFQNSLALNTCGVLSTRLEDEIKYVGEEVLFANRGGGADSPLVVTYEKNSPLVTLGAKLSLSAIDMSTPDLLTAEPPFGTEVPMMSDEALAWLLKGSSTKSGSGRVRFGCALFPDSYVEGGKCLVFSALPSDEIVLSTAEKELPPNTWADRDNYLIYGYHAALKFNFKHHKDSDLGMVMNYATDAVMDVSPAKGVSVPIAQGEWKVKGTPQDPHGDVCIFQLLATYRGRLISQVGMIVLQSTVRHY
ncbi:Ig-like domain-containing protein [Pseudomonas guariconensis]|uniref:Ig-like domain-containing protein n=1 Tax=Pseudomonas guariconensis TaxID=1288410 RepID=UPI0018AB59D7|nr:Ig-like domain-containing protein [Pseudomonas guariconensis]MBF8753802.1 hypothetical protein [Pseudomonas guariconensis]